MVNWVNLFFGILCISLLIFFTCSFFDINIPNYKGVLKIIKNTNSDFIIIDDSKMTNSHNSSFINCKHLGGYENITNLRPYKKFIYKNECNKFCVEKSDIKNSIVWEAKEFECRDNKLYCRCGIR